MWKKAVVDKGIRKKHSAVNMNWKINDDESSVNVEEDRGGRVRFQGENCKSKGLGEKKREIKDASLSNCMNTGKAYWEGKGTTIILF